MVTVYALSKFYTLKAGSRIQYNVPYNTPIVLSHTNEKTVNIPPIYTCNICIPNRN